MERKDLKPGMKVRNKTSRNRAEIRGDERGELLPCGEEYVGVRLRLGEANDYHYPYWPLKNLEILSRTLELRFWGYKGTKDEKQRRNEWMIFRPSDDDCEFPSEGRIKELALSLLGTTNDGENRFLSSESSPRYLFLQILPHTDREKIKALTVAINAETK